MLLQNLFWVLSSAAELHSIPPETQNNDIGPASVSFSIELSSVPDFACNKTQPNYFSYNLLRNIGALAGVNPYIRVGGLTQDYALYNASLKVGLVGDVDPAKSTDYPTTTTIGPAFFESYQTWPGLHYSHGFNLALGANSSASRRTLVETASMAFKTIGKSRHYTWEYGNEPNSYAISAEGVVRPPTWNEAEYTKQWLDGISEIQRQMRIHCPEFGHGDYLGFMAPSYDDRVSNLNASIVWNDGLDKSRSVRWYSVHK